MRVVNARFKPYIWWITSALLVALSLLACHPTFLTLFATNVIGGAEGDGGLYVWLTADFHANPGRAFALETTALYPYPITRAWSDSFLLPSLFSHLFMKLGAPLVVAYNLTYLAALVANGLSLIALARALALPWLASLCAGITFANSSYLTGNFGHPQIPYIFWIPLSWSFIIQPTGSLIRWFLAGLSLTGAFYSSVYSAIFCATGASFILVHAVITRRLALPMAAYRGVGFALGASPILFSLPSYFTVADTFGSRALYEATAFAASGLSFISFSAFHPLFGGTSSWTHPEATLCAGVCASLIAFGYGSVALWRFSRNFTLLISVNLIVLAVASSTADDGNISEWLTCLSAWGVVILALALTLYRPAPSTVFLALVAIFCVLSFGPGGSPDKHEPAFAPFALLHAFLPGFDAIRAVSRFGAVVVMGIYIAIAAALSRPLRAGSPLRYLSLCILTTAVVMAENFTPTFPMQAPTTPPTALTELATRRAPHEAAVILPFAGELQDGRIKSWSHFAVLNTKYSLWAAPLNVPIVNGFSGQRSKLMQELPRALESFPSQRGMDHLGRICGVRWVVIATNLLSEDQRARLEARLASSLPFIELTERFSDGSLLLKISPEIRVRSANESPFYAPPSSDVTMQISKPTSPLCTYTLSQLKRAGAAVVTEPFQTGPLIEEGVTISTASIARDAKRPFLLSVNTDTCDAAVRCSPIELRAPR